MDARKEIDFSGLQVLSLVRDNVKVEWTAIGEGLHGDYNSKDPEDIALLRFYVSVLRDGVWEAKEDGSYCTQLPVSISAEEKLSSLEILLNRFHDVLSSDIDVSIKKVGESMSWLDLDTVFKEMHPFDNSDKVQTVPIVETNVTDNLIKAMVAYGIEYNWCDSDIIDTLIEIGITYDDFCHAGANDFVKEYFEIPLEGRTSLNKLIYSASNRAVSMNSSYNAPEKDSISER